MSLAPCGFRPITEAISVCCCPRPPRCCAWARCELPRVFPHHWLSWRGECCWHMGCCPGLRYYSVLSVLVLSPQMPAGRGFPACVDTYEEEPSGHPGH